MDQNATQPLQQNNLASHIPKHYQTLVTVLVFALLTALYIIFALLFNIWPFERSAIAPAPLETPGSVLKMYRNNQLGFEFLYRDIYTPTTSKNGDPSFIKQTEIPTTTSSFSVRILASNIPPGTDLFLQNTEITELQKDVSDIKYEKKIFDIAGKTVYLYRPVEDLATQFYAFQQNGKTILIYGLVSEKDLEPVIDTFKLIGISEDTGWQTYRNNYGFEMKFPPVLDGYQVTIEEIGSNFGGTIFVFNVPTNDKNYEDTSGFVPIFRIYLYHPEYWDKLKTTDGPKPRYLGEDEDYVFAVSTWQDPPHDWQDKVVPFEEIFNSFKIVQ